jgi:hypothetical protein
LGASDVVYLTGKGEDLSAARHYLSVGPNASASPG